MLENNLHPDVAENPCGADRLRRHRQGRAQPGSYQTIHRELMRLGDDETLLVQSGKPVGGVRRPTSRPRGC